MKGNDFEKWSYDQCFSSVFVTFVTFFVKIKSPSDVRRFTDVHDFGSDDSETSLLVNSKFVVCLLLHVQFETD